MSKTTIAWTDMSINPFRARTKATGAEGHFCERISPGCANCYASEWNTRVRPTPKKGGGIRLIGTGVEYIHDNRSLVEHYFDDQPIRRLASTRRPQAVFWWDMTDAFGEWIPSSWRDQCFAAMAAMPWHTHYVLTKRHASLLNYLTDSHRPDIVASYLPLYSSAKRLKAWPIVNVRVGVSVENKAMAVMRFPSISYLGELGWNTMVSMEPLLEHVDVPDRYLALGQRAWVITGGESGRGSGKKRPRPFEIQWAQSIAEQCVQAGVPYFNKQIGTQAYRRLQVGTLERICTVDRKGENWDEWPADVPRIREISETT